MSRGGEVAGFAVLVAVAMSVAGCGGTTKADPSPPVPITSRTVPVSTSPTASPTLDPNSDAAIRAGVEGWVAALNTASRTASITPLRPWATSDCACIGGTRQSTDFLRAHAEYLTVGYRVTGYKLLERTSDAAAAKVVVTTPPYDVVSAGGVIKRHLPADTTTNNYTLNLKGGKWFVFAID